MRSMDSILHDEPGLDSLPDAPESESPEVHGSDQQAETKPADKPVAKTAQSKVEAKPAAKAEVKSRDEEDGEEDDVPADLEGFRRALTAARGDKRRFRKQWREVEKKSAQLEGQLAAMRAMQQQAQPAQKVPQGSPEDSFYANPVAALETMRTELRREQQARLREYSKSVMRAQAPDYDEVVSEFSREVDGTPLGAQLMAQLEQHPDPARYIYEYAKNYSQVRDVGSVDELRKKIEAEVRAELESQSPAQAQRSHAPIPKPSIASARGSGVGAVQAWSGPRSMDDILGSR